MTLGRKRLLFVSALFSLVAPTVSAQRSDVLLRSWEFAPDSINWKNVTVPHDWAIYGPFDRANDLQNVTIEQNGETEASWKTARSGGLPFIGKGYYKTTFEVNDTTGLDTYLLFDGAMSRANVYVNGQHVAYWPYGYNSFIVDLDGVVKPGVNNVEVSLENMEESSRWYPGAGLYRNVHLMQTSDVHIPIWGTYVTTPVVSEKSADVRIVTEIDGVPEGKKVELKTSILGPDGEVVASVKNKFTNKGENSYTQNLKVSDPQLWSPESPALYTARTEVIYGGKTVDSYDTRFGIRTIEFRSGEGFFLNGKKRKIQGVNNHHDLGPLGAAVNKSALRHQIEMLQDMGADAIRTSHNMPAPELVELADEMGMMLMLETFDDWSFRPKSKNGYGSLFNDWAEKDVVNMIRHYRNNPSVIIWSVGNEVPSQWGPDGVAELTFLQDIVHREDPTRPVTNGMDQFDAVVNNGFAATVDIPSFNYKVNRYDEAYAKLPQNIILGTETASTVSSRGQYFFPVELGANVTRDGNQSNAYDVEYCYWSNIPDDDFAADDDKDYNIGQFVWTGFDYLGEPAPYDTDAWPSHSSYFGIIDLASIPKDRYYLYRSRWNEDSPTLHILPHWNWEGREGEVTPVYVYTDSPKAELFINGKSQGIREKGAANNVGPNPNMGRYRLMWNETIYEPGEVKVIAYNADGTVAGEKTIRTAGEPYRLVAVASRDTLMAGADDLAYITISVEDKEGNPVPTDNREVTFKVKGAGTFKATANGDPTSLRSFQEPVMDLFGGMATAIVEGGNRPGMLEFEVSAPGLEPARIYIPVKGDMKKRGLRHAPRDGKRPRIDAKRTMTKRPNSNLRETVNLPKVRQERIKK